MVRVPEAMPSVDEALGLVRISGPSEIMPSSDDGTGGLFIRNFPGMPRKDVGQLIKGELLRSKVFSSDDGVRPKMTLQAIVLKHGGNTVGSEFHISMRYVLKNWKEEVVLDEQISTTGKDDSFLWVLRVGKAQLATVQKNVNALVDRLKISLSQYKKKKGPLLAQQNRNKPSPPEPSVATKPTPTSPFSANWNKGMGAFRKADYATALKEWKPLAEHGDVQAQRAMGRLYYRGFGVLKNYAKALKWYRLAADQGSPVAKSYVKDLELKIAQQRKEKQSPPSLPQIATNTFPTKPINVLFRSSKTRPDDVAVIIGNADYTQGKDIPNVAPAYADAEGMKRYVKQALGVAEDNIIFLKDATQKDLTATFGTGTNHKGKLFRYLTKGKSKVFIFYSGHGAPGDEGTNYLVPVDAEASFIELNGYPIKTLYKNLSKLPAKSVTVVLEACFSGTSQGGSLIQRSSGITVVPKASAVPSNITVISAGTASQIASWEEDKSHSLFTKYFLKGMSGEADANKDSKVSWAELKDYLAKTVTRFALRYYGREQTVQIVSGG